MFVQNYLLNVKQLVKRNTVFPHLDLAIIIKIVVLFLDNKKPYYLPYARGAVRLSANFGEKLACPYLNLHIEYPFFKLIKQINISIASKLRSYYYE